MYKPSHLKIKNIISHTNSEYAFKNGKAIIIVGVNHDNPNQAGNGSGKSALIESLALAVAGTSIRDVKVKELINRQAKDGEVEFSLYNTITKKNLIIWRKFYTNTKSAECRVWVGKRIDDDEVRLSDINTYNRFIFDEIGISKEDFFNFYLLVEDNYSPFLRATDLKKKETMNRFSGAESIDQLIPLVKEDCKSLQPDIDEKQEAVNKIDIQLETYNEQLEQLKEKGKNLKQTKKEQTDQLELQLTDIDYSITTKSKEIETKKTNLALKNKEITSLDKEVKINKLKTVDLKKQTDEKTKLETANETAKTNRAKVQEKFKTQIDQVKTDEKTANEQLVALKAELKEFEDFESEVNKNIQDSVECPKCSHKFSIRNEEFNHEEAVAQLPMILEEIKTIKKSIEAQNEIINTTIVKRKKDINDKILLEQEKFKKEIEDNNTKITNVIDVAINSINQQINQLNNQHTLLNNESTAIDNQITLDNKTLEGFNSQKQTVETAIQTVKNYKIDEEVEELTEKITKHQENRIILQTDLDELNQTYSTIGQWETNFKNFKSFIANQSINNIQDYTNLFLQQMGTDLTIKLDGFSELANGKTAEKISIEVLRGGFSEGSYGAFSGGERGRIDICVIIAIQQLINLNCASGGLDLLICDEILDQVDTLGLESIINSLQNLDRTIMIVSQNEINALKDYTLKIEKRNKISTFVA